MRREIVLGLGLAVLAGAAVLLAGGSVAPRAIAAAVLLVGGTALACVAKPWPKRAGAAAVVAGLALAPLPTSAAVMLGGTLAAIFGLGIVLFGIPKRAFMPAALFAGIGVAVSLLPSILASDVVDITSPSFLLLCVGLVGPPCAAIAIIRRERHLELVG